MAYGTDPQAPHWQCLVGPDSISDDGNTVQAFPNSAVVGPWVSIESFPNYNETEFTFSIDGQERQRGALKQMMYSTQQAIEIVRDSFTLVPGDVIFTGTGTSASLLWRSSQDVVNLSGDASSFMVGSHAVLKDFVCLTRSGPAKGLLMVLDLWRLDRLADCSGETSFLTMSHFLDMRRERHTVDREVGLHSGSA